MKKQIAESWAPTRATTVHARFQVGLHFCQLIQKYKLYI